MTASRRRTLTAAAAALLVATAGCAAPGNEDLLGSSEVATALAAVEPGAIEHHIGVLAHDSLQGRAPGTPGYEGAALYAENVLRDLGLGPAGENGTYRQAVPLLESMVVESESSMSIHSGDRSSELVYDMDFYLAPDPLREEMELDDVPVVFVGFGVSAPRARLRRLRRCRRLRKGGGLPERRPVLLPEQRARLLLLRRDQAGRGDRPGSGGRPHLLESERPTLPLGGERGACQARELRLAGRAGHAEPRQLRDVGLGVPEPPGRGDPLRGLAAPDGRHPRGGRVEHATGLRPGDHGHHRDPHPPTAAWTATTSWRGWRGAIPTSATSTSSTWRTWTTSASGSR